MKTLVVLTALVAAACAFIPSDEEVKSHWEGFKVTHEKVYQSPAEEAHRLGIFKENLVRIHQHNALYDAGEVTFKVGVNKYADMLTHEVTEKLNGFRMEMAQQSGIIHQASNSSSWPWGKNVDWRSKGYVTPVKDQGQCGSCWSFSATGSLEGQLFKKTGKLVSLSEQNLVDCAGLRYGNEGCNGGLMDAAFQYVHDNKGIDTEASYPYETADGTCRYSEANRGGTCTGFIDVKEGDESNLKDAVAKVGPVSVAIDASNWSFQMYSKGVYYEKYCSSTQLDHGVLAVGYGVENDSDYWLVKNSWGSSWGENGYIKIARNKKNHCGIATMASYPTV